jgi:hypothetical protein
MNPNFYQLIKNSTAHTQSRELNGKYILANPHFLNELIQLSFDIKDKNHIKACNVLEKTVDMKIEIIKPHLDSFCNKLYLLKNDSAIRPIARIVKNIVFDNAKNKNYITAIQLEKIIDVCFDWLIADIRMAPKVYAMYTLHHIGKTHPWIYPDLKSIIEQDAPTQTIGYKSAAKKILVSI